MRDCMYEWKILSSSSSSSTFKFVDFCDSKVKRCMIDIVNIQRKNSSIVSTNTEVSILMHIFVNVDSASLFSRHFLYSFDIKHILLYYIFNQITLISSNWIQRVCGISIEDKFFNFIYSLLLREIFSPFFFVLFFKNILTMCKLFTEKKKHSITTEMRNRLYEIWKMMKYEYTHKWFITKFAFAKIK